MGGQHLLIVWAAMTFFRGVFRKFAMLIFVMTVVAPAYADVQQVVTSVKFEDATMTGEVGGLAPFAISVMAAERSEKTITGSLIISANASEVGVVAVGSIFNFQPSLPGIYILKAHYQGDANFSASDSEPVSFTALAATDPKDDGNSVASAKLHSAQDSTTQHMAQTSSTIMTLTLENAIKASFGDGLILFGGSQNAAHVVIAPGMKLEDKVIEPTAALPPQLITDSMWRFWADLRYTGWKVDMGAMERDGSQVNGMAGASARFSENLILGVVSGYEKFDSETNLGDRFDATGLTLGGYLGWRLTDAIRFDGHALHSWLSYDGNVGAAAGTFEASRMIVSASLTHGFNWRGLDIESSLRGTGTWEDQDGYMDSLLVAHAANAFNYGIISSGTKISHRFTLDDGASITPFISSHTDYRFSDGQSAFNSSADRWTQRLGLGSTYSSGHGFDLGLEGELIGLGLHGKSAASIRATLNVAF